MVDHGSQWRKEPKGPRYQIDESEEEGNMGDMDNEEKEDGDGSVPGCVPNRAINP